MQDLFIDRVHRLIVAAAVLDHPRVLPRSLKRTAPPPQKSEPHQSNQSPQNKPTKSQSRWSHGEVLTGHPQPPGEEEGVPGKLRELTAMARTATRRAPAAAYCHRPPRRRLPPPTPAAAPFSMGAGFVVISRAGAEASRSEI